MIRCFVAVTVLTGWAGAATAASPLCASPEQVGKVRPLYAQAPMPPTFMAATKLGIPEALVASAIAGKQAIGTTGAGFEAVWKSLQEWDKATLVVPKAGQVLEVHGRIPPGAPSEKSQYFNLNEDAAGLGGHLRPDLLGAIYAVDLVGADGPVRGITFVDGGGEDVFGVYVPEGAEPTSAVLAQFEKTRALIASLPRVCG